MERVLILNGSPRAPRSNSKRYGEIFAACYGENAELCPITKGNHQELRDKLDGVSHLLFVFPLYADALPVPLLHFLKFLEDHPPQRKPTVSVLINCGFLEPRQNEIAVEMMRLFCRQNRLSLRLRSGHRQRRGHPGLPLPLSGGEEDQALCPVHCPGHAPDLLCHHAPDEKMVRVRLHLLLGEVRKAAGHHQGADADHAD